MGGAIIGRPQHLLAAARTAFEERDWAEAARLFAEAAREDPLTADDLSLLAEAWWWLGQVDAALDAHEEAYRLYLHGEQPQAAAMSAMVVAFSLFLREETALASGWMSRAQRLLEGQPEGPEHGYVRYLQMEDAFRHGEGLEQVIEDARRLRRLGATTGDPNLEALAVLAEGRARVQMGDVAGGMPLLDEAMLAALSDELDPSWAGNIYCHLMSACHELADLQRAAEWTETTWHWCSRLPPAVLFTGICRVHRAQVFQAIGAWEQAEAEARRVQQDLGEIHLESVAEASYALADLRRLRGEWDAAEEAYHEARRLGRDPQPGLALLRVAQGRFREAITSLRSALTVNRHNPLRCAPLLAALVEAALGQGDVETAQGAVRQLSEIAIRFRSPGFEASAPPGRAAPPGRRPPAAAPTCRG